MKKIIFIVASMCYLQANAKDGKVKLSFGTFASIDEKMQNKSYSWQQVPGSNNNVTNSSNYILAESGLTPQPIGISGMVNLDFRIGEDEDNNVPYFGLGVSSGVGIALQSPAKFAYLLGGSLFIGEHHQLIVTGGVAAMFVNRLNSNLQAVADQQITYTSPPNIQYYKQLETGGFISITFTPSSK